MKIIVKFRTYFRRDSAGIFTGGGPWHPSTPWIRTDSGWGAAGGRESYL